MDPLMFVGEVPHPFAFFGITPTLFDAPSRRSRADLTWLAHTFLCHIKDFAEVVRVVEPITGFSWGFDIAGGTTTIEAALPLRQADWKPHLDLLHEDHPGWRFLAGFAAA